MSTARRGAMMSLAPSVWSHVADLAPQTHYTHTSVLRHPLFVVHVYRSVVPVQVHDSDIYTMLRSSHPLPEANSVPGVGLSGPQRESLCCM